MPRLVIYPVQHGIKNRQSRAIKELSRAAGIIVFLRGHVFRRNPATILKQKIQIRESVSRTQP